MPEWTREDADALRAAVGRFVRAGRRSNVLAPPQATVLGYLDREGPLAITELAERAHVRHQSMRKTVLVLQRDQALATAKSPTDARKVVCAITARGRARLDEDREARAAWILAAVNRRLSPEQRAVALQIAGILDELAGELEPTGDAAAAAQQRPRDAGAESR